MTNNPPRRGLLRASNVPVLWADDAQVYEVCCDQAVWEIRRDMLHRGWPETADRIRGIFQTGSFFDRSGTT